MQIFLINIVLLVLATFNSQIIVDLVPTPNQPHKDHLGSPVAASDVNGNVLWRDVYTPFGERVVGLNGDSSVNRGLNDNDERPLLWPSSPSVDPQDQHFWP